MNQDPWMLESEGQFAFFEYFRIPHRVVEPREAELPSTDKVFVAADARALRWPNERFLTAAARRTDFHFVDSIPIFGRVLADEQMRALVQQLPGSWEPAELVQDAAGAPFSNVWRADDGSSVMPFDPSELISSLWTEKYTEQGHRARVASFAARGRGAYYRVRPLLPRRFQIRFRRSLSRLQKRAAFPRWPVETALDDLYTLLFRLLRGISDAPIPFIAPWPKPWSWALVLTHDVERDIGYRNLHRLLEIELEAGYRSSCNFVPCNDYVVERGLLDRLRADGLEIGVHGLFHDGRDVLPQTLPRRLSAIRSYADQWDAVGFRSPATIRSPRVMPLLGFDYDSSYSDTAPFEPQAGGCCTWLPYMLDSVVELPITLEQDHTLFELLQYPDENLWIGKARLLRERGGMALMLTHPDYVGNPRLLPSYRRFLEEFAEDDSAWKALPREVSAWWRRRNESSLEWSDGEWRVIGPAASEARVELVGADVARV